MKKIIVSAIFVLLPLVSAAACVNLVRNFSLGSGEGASNQQVKELQTFLQTGFAAPLYAGAITGFYDRKTVQAVKNFQAKEHLAQTGNIDTATSRRLYDLSCRTQMGGSGLSCASALSLGDKRLPVLMYHWICDGHEPECSGANKDYYLSSAQLRAQMAALKKAGFASITDLDYLAWRRGLKTLPAKPIMFVWDDGWKSSLTKAAPILKEFGYVGVAAIITDRVGSSWRYLTWAEIEKLRTVYGWSLASHTTNHCGLAGQTRGDYSCSAGETADETLLSSRSRLLSETGIMPITLIHPGNAWTPESVAVCAKYYSLCFGPAYPVTEPHFIGKRTGLAGLEAARIAVTKDLTPEALIKAVTCAR